MINATNENRSQPIERLAYTKVEAAQCLGVSVRTVEGLIERGELRTKLVGRHLLIPRASLERLLR